MAIIGKVFITVLNEDGDPVATIAKDDLMAGYGAEVVTRRGNLTVGSGTECDIQDSIVLPWYELDRDVRNELIKAQVHVWALRLGYALNEVVYDA